MCKRNALSSIIKQLRKYPFTEKMLLCQSNATKIMKPSSLDFLEAENAIYPWELEVFAELSLFADGPEPSRSFRQDTNKFIKMINTIRNYQHPYLKKQKNLDFADSFIMATGLQQFKAQENIIDRLYRYDFFWNFINDKINMPNIFSNHFGNLNYADFKELGVLIFFYASLKFPTAQIFRAICLKYKQVVDFLKLSREDYKKQQSKKIDDNYENVIYGFNYLHPYPFIECQGYYFMPLPYLIIDAVTDSLLTRVTINDNSLREKIGREVAQSYIETILKESGCYEEILPETDYHIGKRKLDAPDVLIKQGDNFCFIDTKLSTPKLELRKFNPQEIKKTTSQYAKNIIQVYNRVLDFCNGHYYPFSASAVIDKQNTFGIVTLLEDSYISKRRIFDEVFYQLSIDPKSEEASYIRSHIKITNFRDLEMFAFRSYDIFVALKEKSKNSREWNDMGLFNEQLFTNIPLKTLLSRQKFIASSKAIITESIEELVLQGIIPKN